MTTSEATTAGVAIVTGAGARQGIGFATGRRLARDGYRVAITDVDGPAAAASAEELASDGFDAIAFEADVSSPDAVRTMVAGAVDAFGGIDVLVNNAAAIVRCEPQDLTDEQARSVLDVNLLGAFRCAREAFPALRQSAAPSIVNVTSTTGRLGTIDSTAYAMSKAGLTGLTHSLAVSWARFGTRVNVVARDRKTSMIAAAARSHVCAIASILMRAPVGRPATANVVRAGRGSPTRRP